MSLLEELCEAAAEGDAPAMRALLAAGAPLYAPTSRRRVDEAHEAITSDDDPDGPGCPLGYAIGGGCGDCVDELLRAGADAVAEDDVRGGAGRQGTRTRAVCPSSA